jgi:hypothetical protein
VDCTVDANYEWMPSMMSASSQHRLRAARPVTSTLVDHPRLARSHVMEVDGIRTPLPRRR